MLRQNTMTSGIILIAISPVVIGAGILIRTLLIINPILDTVGQGTVIIALITNPITTALLITTIPGAGPIVDTGNSEAISRR